MILRIKPAEKGNTDCVVVTIPARSRESEAWTWLESQKDWIQNNLARLNPQIPFTNGSVVPFLGQDHQIMHKEGRGTITRHDGELHVFGKPEHLPRRLTDWLKAESRRYILTQVNIKTEILGKPAGKISIRDTRSRWGSCAANGNLSFCWRLIMSPEWVLEYIVAHEVAHLKHHNHGPDFWAQVNLLTEHKVIAEAWLKKNGSELWRYG